MYSIFLLLPLFCAFCRVSAETEQLVSDPNFQNIFNSNSAWKFSSNELKGQNYVLYKSGIDSDGTVKQSIQFSNGGTGTLGFDLKIVYPDCAPFQIWAEIGYDTKYFWTQGLNSTDYVHISIPFTLDKKQKQDLTFVFRSWDFNPCAAYIYVTNTTIYYEPNYIGTWYYVLLGIDITLTIGLIIVFGCFTQGKYYKKFV